MVRLRWHAVFMAFVLHFLSGQWLGGAYGLVWPGWFGGHGLGWFGWLGLGSIVAGRAGGWGGLDGQLCCVGLVCAWSGVGLAASQSSTSPPAFLDCVQVASRLGLAAFGHALSFAGCNC